MSHTIQGLSYFITTLSLHRLSIHVVEGSLANLCWTLNKLSYPEKKKKEEKNFLARWGTVWDWFPQFPFLPDPGPCAPQVLPQLHGLPGVSISYVAP